MNTAALPTGSCGRSLALGLLLVCATILYLGVASPLLDLYVVRAGDLETKRALFTKLETVAAQVPDLRRRVAAARAAGESRKLTFEGTSDAVASASLQGRLEEFARADGATIGSTESLPAQLAGDFRRIGIRLVINAPYESLLSLLGDIDAASPPLIIDNLQIHGFQRRPGEIATALDAAVEVFGFRATNAADSVRQ